MGRCKTCGKRLTQDEIAFHKKIYNRAASEFFCLDCSSVYLNVPKKILEDKLEYYKSMGCTLFVCNQKA